MKPGWWNPSPWDNRSKFHYIGKDGKSLCSRWLYVAGTIEEGMDEHKENCHSCYKKKLALRKE